MIIELKISNWMSFRDEQVLSFIPTQERQHKERLSVVKRRYNQKVLPVAAIFGPNASGKTNLIRAMWFLKRLANPYEFADRPIAFLFEGNTESKKSVEIEVTFLAKDDVMYKYLIVFSSTRKIIQETLIKLLAKEERILFERNGSKGKITPGFIKKRVIVQEEIEKLLFEDESMSVLTKMFLLPWIVNQSYLPVIEWFNNMIFPPYWSPFTHRNFLPRRFFNQIIKMEDIVYWLKKFDTGIEDLEEGQPVGSVESISEGVRRILLKDSTERLLLYNSNFNNWMTADNTENGFILRPLMSIHRTIDGNTKVVPFTIESDGTKRLFELLLDYVLILQPESHIILAIDEFEKNLHPLITEALLEGFLVTCGPDRRSQLIFTTHNVLAMDQFFLRRDEMWLTERNNTGVTILKSLAEFKKTRKDHNLLHNYLAGRFGGIPRV